MQIVHSADQGRHGGLGPGLIGHLGVLSDDRESDRN